MTLHDINLTEWVGYIAATLTTSSFVPQALLILRTRNVIGISVGMYWTFTLGIALWLVYGWQMRAWPLIIVNSITFVLAATILITKLTVDRNARRAQRQREARRKDASWSR
jgi:MtN3 and saliva related transmembrane protein